MAKLLAKTSGQGRDDDEKGMFAQVRLARLPAHARARRVADDTGLQVLGAIIFLLIFSFALSCIEQFAQAQQLEYDTEKLAPFKAKAVAAARAGTAAEPPVGKGGGSGKGKGLKQSLRTGLKKMRAAAQNLAHAVVASEAQNARGVLGLGARGLLSAASNFLM